MVTLQHILPMDMNTTLLVSKVMFRRATKFGLFPRPGYTLSFTYSKDVMIGREVYVNNLYTI
jgi:hypothetical protein